MRLYRSLRIPLIVGFLLIKSKNDTLFGERYGYTPTCVIGPLRITWRRYRKF